MKKERLVDTVFLVLSQEPMTSFQLETILGRSHQSISPRLTELVKSGFARKTGRRYDGLEVYEVVPGRTLASLQQYSPDTPQNRTPRTANSQTEQTVLQQCLRTAEILKGPADRNEKQRALRALGTQILTLIK